LFSTRFTGGGVPSTARDAAFTALRRADMPWRVAYESLSTASILAAVAAPRARGGRPLDRAALVFTAAMGAVAGTVVVVALARIWDASLAIGWDVIGLLALIGLAFALLQAAVLRWLGLLGIPLLALLYLMAPAAAGLPSELLSPVYRDLIWSWLPFRFSAQGIRSLLYLGSQGPGVQEALWLFGAIGAGALVLLLAPKPHRRTAIAVSPAGSSV